MLGKVRTMWVYRDKEIAIKVILVWESAKWIVGFVGWTLISGLLDCIGHYYINKA